MPLSLDLTSLLPAVCQISRQACQAIMQVYQQADFQVEHKDDASPLTAADLAAHRCIVAGLQQLTPDIPVLSEESADIDWETRQQWDTYWLVDPLDGTKEFVKRNGEFSVNIALIQQHYPTLAVVSIPTQDKHYYAAQPIGAFCQQAQQTAVALHCRAKTGESPWCVTGSRSHDNPKLVAFLEQLGEHQYVRLGSSLKLCNVAEGAADCYPRIGLTSEWDTAAAQGIVEMAGGIVTDLQGQRLRYNGKQSLLNPNFLVCHPDNLQTLLQYMHNSGIQ